MSHSYRVELRGLIAAFQNPDRHSQSHDRLSPERNERDCPKETDCDSLMIQSKVDVVRYGDHISSWSCSDPDKEIRQASVVMLI